MLYYPEGALYNSNENIAVFSSTESIKAAQKSEKILEGIAERCNESHDILVSLYNNYVGKIPREDGALGILEGTTKDIALISKVGKPVCFVVKSFDPKSNQLILSRRRAQQLCYENYISKLTPGDIIPAVVTHMEKYGSFVDIGCGIASLIPIAAISVSRIDHPNNRFTKGQKIFAVVKSIENDRKICLSHKELLGTWLENAEKFKAGETVCGTVRSITDYGIFVELQPNLAGLAENKEGVEVGNVVSVFIKSLIPAKMKAKLTIVDCNSNSQKKPEKLQYFITSGHLTDWQYSPENCEKVIKTVFY